MGSLFLPSGSWCVQDFVCALQDWSLSLAQSCRSPVIKSLWPLTSDSLEIPSPFVRLPGWEAWHGVQNLHNNGRISLVLLFSGSWVTHLAGMGFDFIVIAPFLLFCCSFFFCLWTWVIFFWWVPVSSCQWFFHSWLQFWCSHRRRWAHILLSPPPWTGVHTHMF